MFARLKERGKALCVADSEKLETPLEVTADFGYFRLRDEGYQPNDIEEWAGKTVRYAIARVKSTCISSTKNKVSALSSHANS